MINISQALIDHIVKNYQLSIVQVVSIGSVLKCVTTENKNFTIKKVRNKEMINIYKFLISQKFDDFIMPIQTIHNELFTLFDQNYYYLLPWYENIDYPIERKIIDYIDLLYKLHKATTIRKNFNFSQFNRLYKKKLKQLNRQFQLLDLYLVECENKSFKSIFDWTYLVKYNEIMYTKTVLLKLQNQIDQQLEGMEQYDYCIIHNNSSIDHFIVTNEKNYLISFDHSSIGFKVHDYIKLFIDYSEYDVDWMMLIINDQISKFEFYYFIFNVLFYVIRNIEITFLSKNSSFESINILVHNLLVCAKAVELYQKYESSTATEQKE